MHRYILGQLKPITSEKNIKKMSAPNNTAHIFICYAHKDNESPDPSQRWLDRLLEQLEPLNLQEQAEIWSDKKLEIGDEWHEEIQSTLQQVKAAVLLVSPAFLASKYIRNSEVPFLLKQAKEQGVKILPIILRYCQFNETKFKYPDPTNGPEELSLSTLQVANSPTKPLNSMAEHEQDKVLLSVAQRLLKIINTPVVEQFPENKNASSSLSSVQMQPDKKQRMKMSRGRQFEIERFQQELEKIENDYRNVAEKKRRESNPQEQNNLELQLQSIAKQMDKIEQQINELIYGDE